MKSYKNKTEYFTNLLEPEDGKDPELFNLFNIYSQDKFNRFLSKKTDLEVAGELTEAEEKVIKTIKSQIGKLLSSFPDAKPERLEFDLAKILYSNLRELGFGRYHTTDIGMWRWMSMNYFKKRHFGVGVKGILKKETTPKLQKQHLNIVLENGAGTFFPGGIL